MDGNPVTVGILEIIRNRLPAFALEGFDDAGFFGIDGKGNAEVHGVGYRIFGFGDDLRDRLTGIFVIDGHVDAGFFGDELKHIAPAGPFSRNVVADGGLAGLRKNVCEAETAHHQSGTKS